MTYTKPIEDCVRRIVRDYRKFDKLHMCHTVNINDIDEIHLEEFSSIVMSQDKYLANEATGSDNPAYETNMLPALIKLLDNPADKESNIEFINTWKAGISSYFRRDLEGLVNIELFETQDVNENHYYINDEHIPDRPITLSTEEKRC